MSKSLLLRAALVCSTMMTLASCGTLEGKLRSVSRDKGTAAARVTLPDLPADCRKSEAHAELKVGAEVRSILKRERTALDRANARVGRCASHYDGLKDSLR